MSLGHNLDTDGSCGFSAAGDISNGDPNLGPLHNNGGQTTTRALLPRSDAIDAGDNAICAADPVNGIDQRGVSRPQDGDGNGSPICDIGAYELQPPQPTETPAATPSDTATPSPTATVTPTPRPISRPNLGGLFGPLIQQPQPTAVAPQAGSQPTIQPPNTGDGGLAANRP